MIHLLSKANYTVKQWKGFTINPGELITSIEKLSKETGLSLTAIRTCLKKLKKTHYINTHSTNKFTIVKINKSDIYDAPNFIANEQISSQITNGSQTKSNPLTTTKKVKKEEDIKERLENFKNQVFQFSKFYSQEHLSVFYNYYSTINSQTGRQKFEEYNNWNLEDRLKTWRSINSSSKSQTFSKNR
jgi:DNA-binding transcriptional regulator YhcF (GntR family)